MSCFLAFYTTNPNPTAHSISQREIFYLLVAFITATLRFIILYCFNHRMPRICELLTKGGGGGGARPVVPPPPPPPPPLPGSATASIVPYRSYHHDWLLAVRLDGCEVMDHGGIISRRLAGVGRRSADVLATGHPEIKMDY